MGAGISIIETGVDKLVNLIKQRGKISLQDAAKELGVSMNVIEEWSDFLEEEGIISIEYKLTKPYLVERKMTKKEIETKVKEFDSKKDVFVRKAESTMGFLEKEGERLKGVKGEFDKLRKDLGIEVDGVKKQLKDLERYESMKKDIDNKLAEQKDQSKKMMEDMNQQIIREQRKYEDILQEIKKEEEELQNEKKEAKTIQESEEKIMQKLSELEVFIQKMEDKLQCEEGKVGITEKHIERLRVLSQSARESIEKDKKEMEATIKKQIEQEQKIMEIRGQTLEKIKEESQKFGKYDDASKNLKKFFSERMKIFEMIDEINKERDDMEKDLGEVIRKAKSIVLSSSSSKDVSKNISDLEKRFNDVEKKKIVFEQELKKVSSFLGLK